jgi:hypothetical protein
VPSHEFWIPRSDVDPIPAIATVALPHSFSFHGFRSRAPPSFL